MSDSRPTPPAAAQTFNKFSARVAGKRGFPLWGLIKHRGRKSGKEYETPVAIVSHTDHAVYIALPWGRKTDWVRNLQANAGILAWRGSDIAIVTVSFVEPDEAMAAANRFTRTVLKRWGVSDVLKLDLSH